MISSLFRGYSYVLTVIVILILVSPSLSSSDTQNYTRCEQLFNCGNIRNIDYPFWGDTRPNSCGHPSFELTNCQANNTPIIKIQSISYQVISIDYNERFLRVARGDYWNCLQYPQNVTLDSYFSNAVDTVELILFYNCRINSSIASQVPNQFSCIAANGSFSRVFYAIKGVKLNDGILCDTRVSAPVVGSEISDSMSFNASHILMAGFKLMWNENNSDCDKCIGSGGRCGSVPNNGSFYCYRQPSMGSLVFCKNKADDEIVEAFVRNHGSLAPKRYKYSKIKKITNSFKDKLGEGGFGVVYKGELSDGQLIAVKVLNKAKANGEDFFNEVASISRTSHVNVVSLLGFCFEKKKKALIYEYMVRGSLDKAIQDKLEWKTLFEIAVGVVRGLEYLHRGCNTRIVHFDIKPHNILLDENFHPKISDFGLAKLCQNKQSKISMLDARGTAGYTAPEVFSRAFGCVSYKSDVYSYGMLILEMTGTTKKKGEMVQKSEAYFPDWIFEHLEQDKDFEFKGVTTKEDEETAKKMVLVGLWCIQSNPLDRPPMSKVVEMLERNIESLQIPPKPSLFSPPTLTLFPENSSVASSSISDVSGILGGSG